MHRAERTSGDRRMGEIALSVLASLGAAAVVVAGATAARGDVTVVVPNAYSCSHSSDTCRQTNPPYAPTAPNQCTWVTSTVRGAVPADRVC